MSRQLPAYLARATGPSGSRAGFTLIELLVALAVLAIIAMVVFGRGGDSVRDLYTLEQQTLARWVAENHVARLRLEFADLEPEQEIPVGSRRDRVQQGDRAWVVKTQTRSTKFGSMREVEVSVLAIEGEEEVGPVDSLIAYLGRH